MSWELIAVAIVAVLGVLGLVVYFATDAKGEGKGNAVAVDDLSEADSAARAVAKAQEAQRGAPKTPRALVEHLRARFRMRGDRKT